MEHVISSDRSTNDDVNTSETLGNLGDFLTLLLLVIRTSFSCYGHLINYTLYFTFCMTVPLISSCLIFCV